MEIILNIILKEVYLLGLVGALIIGNILKHGGYFSKFYIAVGSKLKNKKATLALMSLIGGVLPVDGRCSISAPFLDSISKDDHKGREKLGLVDYISTHHYYLWSPIEPSVVIFMAALGLTWSQFLSVTAPLLVVYFIFFMYLMLVYVDEDDIEFRLDDQPKVSKTDTAYVACTVCGGIVAIVVGLPFYYSFVVIAALLILKLKVPIKTVLSYLNWNLLFIVGIIIAVGVVAKGQYGNLLEYLKHQEAALVVLLGIGGLSAFLLGSSSKYAGIGAMLAALTSVTYLPLIIAVEFAGYLLSPVHKCMMITKTYFNTPFVDMYKHIVILAFSLVTAAFVTFLVQ